MVAVIVLLRCRPKIRAPGSRAYGQQNSNAPSESQFSSILDLYMSAMEQAGPEKVAKAA
jgi:hypothetical protein